MSKSQYFLTFNRLNEKNQLLQILAELINNEDNAQENT